MVVTGVSWIEPPPSVGAVSVSGMNPDVDAPCVGDGEYGTSGSTPEADGAGMVAGGGVLVVVAPVHAAATISSAQGRDERGRRMGDAGECSRSG